MNYLGKVIVMSKKPICFRMFPEKYPHQIAENDCESCEYMCECVDKTRIVEKLQKLYKKQLKKIYSEIDRLEKTKAEITKYTEYRELFGYFLIPAIILVLMEFLLTNTVFRKIP